MAYLHATGGYSVPINEGLAVIYDYFAATGGSVPAAMSMGYRYLYGRSVPQKCEAALVYYELAANHAIDELAHGQAFLPLTEFTRLTDDMDKSKLKKGEDEIIQYYHYSAEKGDASAQIALGQLHYYGARGVELDYAQALRYFTTAFEQGQNGAVGNIGHMYVQGLGVRKNVTEAHKYFVKGASMGQATAQNGLGYMHALGLHVNENRDKAIDYFKLAAEQGNVDALYNLGALHLTGRRKYRNLKGSDVQQTSIRQSQQTDRNFGKALQYFTLAAQNGQGRLHSHTYTLALHKLALMHANGLGTGDVRLLFLINSSSFSILGFFAISEILHSSCSSVENCLGAKHS